jgi:hypothetical protein
MEDTWEAFVKIYKEAKLFKNHGWIHLEKMLMIMPVVPNGPHVFFPSQGLSGVNSFLDHDDDILPYAINTQDDEDAYPVTAAPAAATVSCSHSFND